MSTDTEDRRPGRGRRIVLLALGIGALVLAGGYLLLAGAGTESSSPPASSDTTASMGSMDGRAMSFARLDPSEFATRMAEPSAFVVNVHVPYDGEIDGTDAFIPYTTVVGDPRLPADKDAAVLLYCRSGSMSASAAADLVKAGYTNVADLEGGMAAWQADGRTVSMRSGG